MNMGKCKDCGLEGIDGDICYDCKADAEVAELRTEIAEQGESIGALMAKGISDCTARDKRIEELEDSLKQKHTRKTTAGVRRANRRLRNEIIPEIESERAASEQRVRELEKRVVQANTDVRALPRYSYHNGDYYTAVISLTPVFDILDALASPTTEDDTEEPNE